MLDCLSLKVRLQCKHQEWIRLNSSFSGLSLFKQETQTSTLLNATPDAFLWIANRHKKQPQVLVTLFLCLQHFSTSSTNPHTFVPGQPPFFDWGVSALVRNVMTSLRDIKRASIIYIIYLKYLPFFAYIKAEFDWIQAFRVCHFSSKRSKPARCWMLHWMHFCGLLIATHNLRFWSLVFVPATFFQFTNPHTFVQGQPPFFDRGASALVQKFMTSLRDLNTTNILRYYVWNMGPSFFQASHISQWHVDWFHSTERSAEISKGGLAIYPRTSQCRIWTLLYKREWHWHLHNYLPYNNINMKII